MKPLGIFKIFNMPEATKLCSALASSFNNFSQAFCEFIDNALSNLMAHRDDPSLVRVIRIVIRNQYDSVAVTVEDGGTGVLDLNNAFTLCGTDNRDTPLNASGCGFKHSFAYVESNGSSWEFNTRTREDAAKGRYCAIHAPYDFGNGKFLGTYMPGWVGTLGETGTVIRFTCPMDVFATLYPTPQKENPAFHTLVAILRENLRYIYADFLQDGVVSMELVTEDNGHEITETLTPLTPPWDLSTWKEIPPQTVDLGNGTVEIHCQYGEILGDESNLFHYRGNMESNGVEICLNGRVIERGLLTRIWGRKVHPSQNGFLARVNLVTESVDAAPMTKAAKNGFREEDPRLKKLFLWIRTNVVLSEEHVWESKEKKLLRNLAEKLQLQPDITRVSPELGVFRTLGLNERMDLMTVRNNEITIYEGKARNTKAVDVYQLRMYWDACVQDKIPPKEGILIAPHHPREVQILLEHMNTISGPDGRLYNFRLTTWMDENISIA